MAQSGEGASGLYRGAQAGYFCSGAISFRHRERRFEFLEPVVRAAFQRTTFSASYLLPVHYEDNPCAKPPSERLQCAVPGYARPERVAGQRYDDALSGSCGAVRQYRPRERPYPAAASRSGRDCRVFRHIRYMMITTVPSLIITLIIFTVAGLSHDASNTQYIAEVAAALNEKFHITPYLGLTDSTM